MALLLMNRRPVTGVARLTEHGVAATFTLLVINPDELHYFYLIKPNYRFTIDNRHRRALIAQVDQLFQRSLVGAHIFFHELDALLR
jgi:hypothetical protein